LGAAAAEIATDVRQRFSSSDKLTDADRQAILSMASKALAPFQSKAGTSSKP